VTLKDTGETFRTQVHRIVIGQEETITLSFLALCLGGHVHRRRPWDREDAARAHDRAARRGHVQAHPIHP